MAAKGSGKITRTSDYMPHGRGTGGQLTFKVNRTRTGPLIGIAVVSNKEQMMFISSGGIVIRTTLEEIRPRGRNTGGVRVMNLDSDDEVAAIARFPEPEEPIPAPPAPNGSGGKNGVKPSAKGGTSAKGRANGKTPAAEADVEAIAIAEEAAAEDVEDIETDEDILDITEDVVDEDDADLDDDVDEAEDAELTEDEEE